MRRSLWSLSTLAPLGLAAVLVGLASLHPDRLAMAQDQPKSGRGAAESKKADPRPSGGGSYGRGGGGYGEYRTGEPDRSKLPDSFKYYGPNGLWSKWSDDQKIGRDTWIMSTFGNQKFYRLLAEFGGSLGMSIDFFRMLDSRRRGERFKLLGLINEPNFEGNKKNKYGFWMDEWKGDPIEGAYPKDDKWYGEPTGIIGLRKFINPKFTKENEEAWLNDPDASVRKYFDNPSGVEPPYLVGISCSLCHIAFDPLNPPKDAENPRWENLAANIGNQYFHEGDMFFGPGRVAAGNANPGPNFAKDPYDTAGLKEDSFLYQYGRTQLPGTSETSRFSYDFINNPNTINQIFYIARRADFSEITEDGVQVITKHILKDGADSIGLFGALLRVPINIGSEGDYWLDHLWNPATGVTQKPFSIREVNGDVPEARWRELRRKYPELGDAWKETVRRLPFLASYLASYTPSRLADIKDSGGDPKYISRDKEQRKRGSRIFADQCARCHSNKQPFYPLTSDEDQKGFFRGLVASESFLPGNTLSDDVRYPFNAPGLGINAARALATNAIEGDIWADFSSKDYKALPGIRRVKFEVPLNEVDPKKYGDTPITVEFVAPGGGRGYYRTASLNSMWTSAPFLHNNSVGRSPVDENGMNDPQYITVEGRLRLFEDAMEQLLSDDRKPFIKVTSADSSLLAGLPGVKPRVSGMLRDLGRLRASEIFGEVLAETIQSADVPDELKPTLRIMAEDLAQRLRPEFDKLYTAENLKRLQGEVVGKVRQQVDALVAEKLQGKPRLQELVGQLKPKFEAAFKKQAADLGGLLQAELTIPKGTPLNLFLNLRADKLPYALSASLKYKDQPRKLAEELLKLSDCPDLVENKGHTYGSDLSAKDKKDLIEYLKTL